MVSLLAVDSRLPCAAKPFLELGVFHLHLPVEVLQLLPDLEHAGKVRTAFQAQLRLLLLQFAVARMHLPQCACRQIAVIPLHPRNALQYQLRVALRCCAILRFAQDAF